MALPLRQSTASQEVPLGYFLSTTDGETAMTGLSIANTDISIWVSGATTLASKNSGGATHIAGGVYYCVLDATDTATLGPLVIFVHKSTSLAIKVECVVLTATNYDAAIAGTVSGIASNIKKNQALATFTFLMTDSTNHAPATGLTVTCTRSIDGAAFGAGTLANTAELSNGIYKVDFGAGDLNGNVIVLKATATGADITFERIVTQP